MKGWQRKRIYTMWLIQQLPSPQLDQFTQLIKLGALIKIWKSPRNKYKNEKWRIPQREPHCHSD